MRLVNILTVLGLCAAPVLAFEEGDELSEIQAQAIEALQAAEGSGTFGKRDGCTLFNARVRKDWWVDEYCSELYQGQPDHFLGTPCLAPRKRPTPGR